MLYIILCVTRMALALAFALALALALTNNKLLVPVACYCNTRQMIMHTWRDQEDPGRSCFAFYIAGYIHLRRRHVQVSKPHCPSVCRASRLRTCRTRVLAQVALQPWLQTPEMGAGGRMRLLVPVCYHTCWYSSAYSSPGTRFFYFWIVIFCVTVW